MLIIVVVPLVVVYINHGERVSVLDHGLVTL
jgi:hypothetical protein